MHRSETYDLATCAVCGAEVSISRDRAYAFGDGEALCLTCAISRGGRYNEQHDHWDEAPKLTDLAR